jgi:hypothetical protein
MIQRLFNAAVRANALETPCVTQPVGEDFPRRGVVFHNVNRDAHTLLSQFTPERLFV